MAASELQFTKSWTSSEDFPTYEPNETQVRADMQLLFDEIKNHINTVLLPDLLKRVPDTRKVNGHALTGDITVSKGDVGLGNVDNTSDIDKPVSTAQQAALDLKADKSNVLEKNGTTSYTPTGNYHPATKKYVDDTLAGAVLGQVPDGSIGSNKLTPELNAHIDQQMPQGGIILWSGAANNVPAGWALCDGQNNTPDLRDKFIVGAGSAYQPGDAGGAATVQLTTNELPAHTHSVTGTAASAGNHTHGDTFAVDSVEAHKHTVHSVPADNGHFVITSANNSDGQNLFGVSTIGSEEAPVDSAGAHTHTLSGSVSPGGSHSHTVSGTAASVGSGAAFSILPPYYALCFIMKL